VLPYPPRDPAPIFELFRGNFATELLTAAITPFNIFVRLAAGPKTFDDLRRELDLAERPTTVLLTALRAFGLLTVEGDRLALTPLARDHLLPDSPFDVSAYVGLAADSPGVRNLVERLRSNQPAGAQPDQAGAAFIFREGLESAMEKEASARHLTLALAGRARNVAPVLAKRYPLPDAACLLDVGGGSGLYSIAWLQRHRQLRAIVWDRPEVLKVARELAVAEGVSDRLECCAGDMFADAPPAGCDVVLFSNVLHDWDVPQCRALVQRCAAVLPPDGRMLIHDAFLNDALDGPLPLALYSAALCCLTEGRLYSEAEYRLWLSEAGLLPEAMVPTLIHCGVLSSRRR
jgi:SAM-dependent methyltransferase